MNGNNENGDFFLKYRNEKLFNDQNSIKECLSHYDKDGDQALDLNEFEQLLKSLFSFSGDSYYIQKPRIKAMFNYFDENKDDKIQLNEFTNFWFKIVKMTILPKSALIIVDVQNDFIDGTLTLKKCPAKQNGEEVIPVINYLLETVPFDTIVYSLDWHPKDHCSFIENLNLRKLDKNSPIKEKIKALDSVLFEDYPSIEQRLWPAHCIQGTHGSQLHPELKQIDEKTDPLGRSVIYVYKGSKSDIDSYSAFFDNCKLNETTLNADLKKNQITDIYVCGLAADVCVAATSFDGLELNYRVVFINDATRGVDLEDIESKKKMLVNSGALVATSKNIHNMVTCRDRRPELAFATFLSLIKSKNVQEQN